MIGAMVALSMGRQRRSKRLMSKLGQQPKRRDLIINRKAAKQMDFDCRFSIRGKI